MARMTPNKRKKKKRAPTRKREWFPKQITNAEYKRRHALHVERQRRMGISDEQMDAVIDGRGELSRMGRA